MRTRIVNLKYDPVVAQASANTVITNASNTSYQNEIV